MSDVDLDLSRITIPPNCDSLWLLLPDVRLWLCKQTLNSQRLFSSFEYLRSLIVISSGNTGSFVPKPQTPCLRFAFTLVSFDYCGPVSSTWSPWVSGPHGGATSSCVLLGLGWQLSVASTCHKHIAEGLGRSSQPEEALSWLKARFLLLWVAKAGWVKENKTAHLTFIWPVLTWGKDYFLPMSLQNYF